MRPTHSSPSLIRSSPMSAPPTRRDARRARAGSAAMADPVLKFPGEQAPAAADAKKKPLSGRLNKSRRLVLLVVIPMIAGVVGLTVYLAGGRYMTTDNAYVGAQKVLV